MPAAIEAMRKVFAALARGEEHMPPRTALSAPGGVSLVMPAMVEGAPITVKVVSIFPGNKDRGVPVLNGLVLALSAEDGRPLALIDGAALTAIRTAAVCGLATDLLARPASKVLAVLGSGVQARTQVEAVCSVRAIEDVRICNPSLAKAEAAAAELRGRGPIPERVTATASSAEALRGADIVSTVTTSREPVLADADLPAGVHINAIGSFQPHVRELPTETVTRALLVVDERASAMEEAGDILQAIAEGAITESHIHCELGDLVLGRAAGRASRDQVTLFKSVGLAVQDVLAAQAALREARRRGLGQAIDW